LNRSTLSPADFPARIYRQQERAPASPARSLVFGMICSASFAWYDPDSSSWRTVQTSLAGGCEKSSEDLPRAGIMRSGKLSELTTLALHIKERESGLWRTPQAWNGQQGPKSWNLFQHAYETGENSITLTDQVRWAKHDGNLPTPVRASAQSHKLYVGGNPTLIGAVEEWPTPQARDHRMPDPPESKRTKRKVEQAWSQNLNDAAGGSLNPDWMECLMGVPVGWTDLACDNPVQMPWPAGYVKNAPSPQYEWEPPRTIVKGGPKDRRRRIAAVGEGQVPQVVERIAKGIAEALRSEGREE